MIILSFTACLLLPWWSIALSSFIVSAFIPQGAGKSFITGFLALLILWGGLSLWISYNNDHILAHRVSLLVLKIDSPYLLILVTAIVGGLVSGLAALTASYLHDTKKHASRVIT